MTGNVKTYIRRAAKERLKWRKRYVKRAAARKYSRYRAFRLLLLIGTVLYLAAIGCFKDLFFQVRQEKTVEYIRAGDEEEQESGGSDLYRLIFRLKSGEIELYHEKMEEQEGGEPEK